MIVHQQPGLQLTGAYARLVPMRRNTIPILLLSFTMLVLPSSAHAEKSFGFFNLKKSVKKPPAPPAHADGGDELTQEEKEMLQKMTSGKGPAKLPAVPRRAPQAPVPPPRNPNDAFKVYIPQPPPHAPKDLETPDVK